MALAFSTLEDMTPTEPPETEPEDLASSFRQSRKEFRFMLGAWVFFALWTGGYNALFAGGRDGEAIELVGGMPSWVFYGVALPWVLALATTIWFAMAYMKDTDLGEDGEERS